jgi:hypothetical protein
LEQRSKARRIRGYDIGCDASLGVACFALRAEIAGVDGEDLKEGGVKLLWVWRYKRDGEGRESNREKCCL